MKKLLLLTFVLSFSLTTFAQTTILTEDFEDATLPSEWSKTSNGVGWLFGVNNDGYWSIPDHTNYAFVDDADAGSTNDASVDYLITPALDLTSYYAVIMTFEVFHEGESPTGAKPVATVEASVDGGDWVVVDTIPYVEGWHSETIGLSDYIGESNVKIAIHFNDSSIWNSGMGIDDIEIYEPSPYNAALISINNTNYLLKGDVELKGTIKNMGAVDITSVNITWTDDNGESLNIDNLTGLNIEPAGTYEFTQVSGTIDMNETQKYLIKAWVSNVNGNPDGDNSNDTISKELISISQVPQKVVVGEEGTGTWCAFCPGGAVALKDLEHYHPDTWIGISVHCTTAGEEPMWYPDYGLYPGKLRGLPNGLIDRAGQCNEYGLTEFVDAYEIRAAQITPLSVKVSNITYNDANRELLFDISSTFYTNIAGNFRINAVITEDSVTGEGEFWAQHNYYSGSEDLIDWEGINWKNLPDPVPAQDMVYMDVARKLFGGWDGTEGSIPDTVVDGTTYTQSYSYIVPDTVNEKYLNVIGMVINNTTEEIMNAASEPLIITSVHSKANNNSIKLYPNPTKGIINIVNATHSNIEIFNINGQKIMKKRDISNFEYINLSKFNDGIYIIRIISGNKITTQKIDFIR